MCAEQFSVRVWQEWRITFFQTTKRVMPCNRHHPEIQGPLPLPGAEPIRPLLRKRLVFQRQPPGSVFNKEPTWRLKHYRRWFLPIESK